ncbi:MAG TPA: BON domain-containing protein [Longimicrobiaceae bacterium]|nr:BON domain-containing protein [Longimicrobiaceae bacterium]
MWEFRERDDADDFAQDALIFALGAAGGFALGLLLSGRVQPAKARVQEWGNSVRERAGGLRDRASDLRERAGGLRERARGVAATLRPGRLRRAAGAGAGTGELSQLEDRVIAAFLEDEVLSMRGIDVGAISDGIVELSGSVWTEDESDRAVAAARRVSGVATVVNRMEVEEQSRRRAGVVAAAGHVAVDDDEDDDATGLSAEWTGRNSGMGRRRQGAQTEPDRSDDSRHNSEVALENADRSQFEDEGYTSRPRVGARPEARPRPGQTPHYREDELDNQSPYGKHAPVNLTEQPQELNSDSRVGDAPKPGVELALEASDVPVKPHGHTSGSDVASE